MTKTEIYNNFIAILQESNSQDALSYLHRKTFDDEDNLFYHDNIGYLTTMLQVAVNNIADPVISDDLQNIINTLKQMIAKLICKELNIFHIYAQDDDRTFIMQCQFNECGEIKTEACIGWYHGEPNPIDDLTFANRLIAEY
jgi:hypothetical protein